MELWYLMLMTFIITFILILWIINYQKRKFIGQIEREEGLRTHKAKNKTPTMAGVGFLISYVLAFSFLLINKIIDIKLYLMLIIPIGSFGLIGLIDDLLILKKGKNDGIKPSIKFLFQIIMSVLYFFIYLKMGYNTTIDLLIYRIDLKFLYGMFILLAFSGFSNAANLTDGIDGLLGGVFSIILIGFFFLTKDETYRTIISILFSGIVAFLYFNLPKAKVFMGNTGSLALGALLVSLAILMKMEIYLFIFGLIFVIEAFSVILQVFYYKKTKGKRLFKMAPIHHHFEIVFNSEIKPLLLFYLFTILTLILGLLINRYI